MNSGVGTHEASVPDLICLRIFTGVADRVSGEFGADDLPRVPCGDETDGPGAAVGIDDRLRAGKCREVHRGLIERLRHHGIDLEEGSGREFERKAAERVGQISRTEERDVLLSQHHARAAVVDVQDDGGHLRMRGGQLLHELVLSVHFRGGGDQDHHHLAFSTAFPHHHVAEKPGLPDLIVDGEAEFLRKAADRTDHGLAFFVVQTAGGDGHDFVAAGCVVTAGNAAVRAARKDLVDLVAVVKRIVHPADL